MINFKIKGRFLLESIEELNGYLPDLLDQLANIEGDLEDFEMFCSMNQYGEINIISINDRMIISNESISLFNDKVTDESKF